MSDELKVIDGGVGAPNAVLKTLDLTGFKSFVHKTHLEFAPGITEIIGPNGSGKTNIVDGIRWALGENNARILRAKRNEELIFGGSESRKALGMAEAIMQLDNSSRRLPIPFEEVEVGRRLYRNGEAEYLVNRSRVRLRDLQDLHAGANLPDREIDRLDDYVREGESATAGTEEELLAAREEEERRRIASADAASAEAGVRERVAALEASLAAIAAERQRTGASLAALPAELATLRERRGRVDAEAAAGARRARAFADAARNELQRIDGDLALLRGQIAALGEAVERAEAELKARDSAGERAALPKGFAWLGDRIADTDAVRAALGASLAAPERAPDDLAKATVPKGCRRVADGVALFVAPDDATALAAAATLRAGAVVAPSGLLVLPGLVRLVDPRAHAERDAATQLRAMASRLREELTGGERARASVDEERSEAERRLVQDEQRLAAAQKDRGDAERVADELATAEADVRDLVRARDASASAVERERADVLVRRERLAQAREAAKAARTQAADAFGVAERDEQAAVDLHNAASRRAEDARLDAATSEERRASDVRLRDTLDEQVSATERRMADEEDRVRALASQEREGRGRLEGAQADLGTTTAEGRDARRSAELARERALAAEGSRREQEQRLAKARERLAELRGERGKLAVEEERAAGGLRLLEEQVRAELGLAEDEPLPDPSTIALDGEPEEKEKTSTLAALQRLRRRLIALEPVNPLAATELGEIGERHDFLSTQKVDLERAMRDLRTLAGELATTIAEQFSATLQAVDREFGVFFQRLFNGGQASLRTSEDVEDPGIDIYARPPGKRIGSLAQLSGGERAPTATALLLAILRVRPAPFCVLDEVDAALDERNVGRFTQALRELTDRTQFVVITHNRATIEAADAIYGVSMDDAGVSKVISLRLADLDAARAG